MIDTLSQLYKKIPRRVVSAVFLIVIIFFLVLYLKGTDFSRLHRLRVDWWIIAVGSLWTLAFRYWMVVIWRQILRSLGSHDLPGFRLMAYIYARAWISRYIPGTVTWIAGKIYMAAGYGISKSRLTVSSALEGGMQVVASTLVSLVILGFNPHIERVPFVARLLVVLVSIACLIVLFPPVFNRLLSAAHVLFKKRQPSEELRISGSAVVWSFVLFAIGTFINGTGAYFIVLAIHHHISLSSYLYIVGAFGLAGAIGIAVPFVPSGLGVRDGALLLLLSAIMPKEVALVLTVFTRLWFVVIDLVFLGAASAVHKLLPAEPS